MSDQAVVDLFVEDRAQEEFLKPLLIRVAEDEGFNISLQFRNARGGVKRAIEEFKTYQIFLDSGLPSGRSPDLLVVAMDGNCSTFAVRKTQIEGSTRENFRHMIIPACPNPHIERWFLADPDSFHRVIGYRPNVGPEKCERGHYKRLLRTAVKEGGHIPTLGGVEFASELVAEMDFYRAGKNDASFKAFLDDLLSRLRFLRHGRV